MDRKILKEFVDNGLSSSKISKELNVSKTTVSYWLKKYNLSTNFKSFKDGYNNYRKVNIKNQKCKHCQVLLTNKNGYTRKNRESLVNFCKKCHSEETKKRRVKFKQYCVDYKGGSCIKCGYAKNLTALEFHHKNPKEKEIMISKMFHKSIDILHKELDKCDLYCSVCHREEHERLSQIEKRRKEFNFNLIENLSDNILTGKITGKKSCKKCDKVLTEDNIHCVESKQICKSCESKRVVERSIKGKLRTVEYMGNSCSVCGYNKCISALEFHHLDPTKKSETFGNRFNTWGFEKQKKELENCILVCSNCHRELHTDKDFFHVD